MKNTIKIAFLLTFTCSVGFSQSLSQRQDIIKETDVATLNLLSETFNAEYLQRKERIESYLVSHPTTKKVLYVDGVKKEIYDVINNTEVLYYSTSNFNAARTARTDRMYSGGSLGLNIQGQGMYAYVWDGGSARNTHVEFPNNKVTSLDGSAFEDHATHVTGTIVAEGLTANLRGLAFNASAFSFDWNNDYTEMADQAANGMLVSNHSYFIGASQTTPWNFGAYDSRARQLDQVTYAAPYYLAVTSAGNDRSDYNDPIIGPYLTEKGGYNLVRGMHNAKNVMTVGAVNQVLTYSSPTSVVMSTFSSWGPTDDGRIKPEIVTKGVSVRSPIATSDTATGTLQGTSMASPGISGVSLLLQQYYESLFATYMRAATLKGLIMHTADEAGYYDGPDYEYGWGLVNAEAASTLILKHQQQNAVIYELDLANGQSYTLNIASVGTNPLMASVSWADPAGAANTTNAIDPTNSNLVNDLDLRVTKGTETFFPWTLNPAVPYDGAVRTADNFRDNFEKVQVDNPDGVYTITVSHKNTLSNGPQKYSLIISSLNNITLNNNQFSAEDNQIMIYPNPVSNVLNFGSQSLTEVQEVIITDISGKQIYTQQNALASEGIDVSSLSSGVYFITFKSNDSVTTKKFIKE
ncbi:MAG: S8 family serine peptidase [Flavobacterium sp.]|nr:S8 family serine peptidase [Flavobacterium sp.]MBP8157595.1 S8 family serine peptidase [Flavobacterium sp.]